MTPALFFDLLSHPPFLPPELQLSCSLPVFLQHTKLGPASGPLHLLFPLPGVLFLCLFAFLIPFYGFILKYALLREAALTPGVATQLSPSAVERDISCQPSAVSPFWEWPQLHRAPCLRSCSSLGR